MATVDQFQAEYDKFNIEPNPDGSYTVDGRRLSVSQFKKLKSSAKKALDNAKKKAKETSKLQETIDLLERQNQVDAAILAGEPIPVSAVREGEEQVEGLTSQQRRENIQRRNERLVELKNQVFTEGRVGVTAGLTPEQQAGLRRRGEVAGGMGATRPRPGEPAPTGPAQPTTPSGGVTTGRGGGRPGGAGRRRVVNWEPKFREMFPAQAWLLDLDRTKYGDVFKLFQKAITDRMYETPEGQARFAAQLDGTSFFKELAQTGKARDIKALVGDLGFDTVPFNKFLTTAMNMGWQGDTLKQEAYKEAFRKDDTGQYVNPTAVKRVQASNDYLRVKNIGKAFFSDVNDSMVESALTGGVTQDDIVRQQRELAKGKYAHLAPLLDQGLTLDDITASYRERAARLLEKDVNDIDMGSADFSQAFNFGEEGKKRMMGDGEWEILLRSDQRFGWRKTQNAKQEATQLASSIAQAFGRVL